jgi:outer membrane protein OmpA-like peptidoglycan-associated protein
VPRTINSPLAICVLGLLSCGCSGPSSQLTSCQQDKEKLLATIRQQRDAGRALQAQVASLETRLDQAEKELAFRSGGTRMSSRPADGSAPLKTEQLPWRSPPGKSNSKPAEKQRTSSSKHSSAGGSLAALAEHDQRLTYDPRSRSAQLDLPVSFEKEGAALTAEGKRQLDEVARLLKSDEARDLRVMVAGYATGRPSTTAPLAEGESRFSTARQLGASRAQAVADYLDRHGIAQERLGVSGVGSSAAPAGATNEQLAASGGVQIYLLEPNAEVIGWGPSGPTVRR